MFTSFMEEEPPVKHRFRGPGRGRCSPTEVTNKLAITVFPMKARDCAKKKLLTRKTGFLGFVVS